jgi:hypothetical protein
MQGTAYEDLEAAKWYEGCHKSTTNEARNSDVQDFWQSCKGKAAGAIKDLTGAGRQQRCNSRCSAQCSAAFLPLISYQQLDASGSAEQCCSHAVRGIIVPNSVIYRLQGQQTALTQCPEHSSFAVLASALPVGLVTLLLCCVVLGVQAVRPPRR